MRTAITERISTRTFEKKRLRKSDIEKIKNIIKEYQLVKGPFGNSFELTFNLNDENETNGKKVGTYGLLKNIPAYIGGICENESESIIDFGFVFELVILELTKLGYSTCWLGGTFKRKDYRKKLEDNQIIPAISPVGFRAEKRTIIDRALRTTAQSFNRLDEKILFLNYEDGLSLSIEDESMIKQCLQLVRKAPSASNKQPWRLFVEGDKVHFFIKRNNGYAKVLNYDIQMLDMGIALSHYDVALKDLKKNPVYYIEENIKEFKSMEYIMSVDMK